MRSLFASITLISILIFFSLLDYELLKEGYSLKYILLILILVLVSPSALAIFIAFLIAPKRLKIEKQKNPSIFALLFLIIGALLGFIMMEIWQQLEKQPLKTILPLYINAIILCFYIFNYFYLYNIRMAGFLTGFSVISVSYIIFFT